MRLYVYNFLVNRHSGIKSRYHKVHDGASGIRRLYSYVYLLWLNICYYLFFCHRLGENADALVYEKKKLRTDVSESAGCRRQSIQKLIEELLKYEVISFDLFDTLVFRPFSEPADVFYLSGEKMGILDFKRIRMEQEYLKRCEQFSASGSYEITLSDIFNRMERETGLSAKEGIKAEWQTEVSLCYANPYMQQVYQNLLRAGKRIIITTDMYLPKECLEQILENCGYQGYQKLYVSNVYGKSKADGSLYKEVLKENPKHMVHVGDHPVSDVKMAKRAGITAVYYPNVNRLGMSSRSYDMSPVIGGAYRGIVNAHLYNGKDQYSMEYEYGFIYGGLFAAGYCHFIHTYCKLHQIKKIVFLSRDGDILKQVYDRLYPDETTIYAYWSRSAGTKLMAGYDRYDYFRRFLYHKVNQGICIQKILEAMELSKLAEEYPDPEELLTDKNVETVKAFLQERYDRILQTYEGAQKAAEVYYTRLLSDTEQAAVVDIGWAGSAAIFLSYLTEQIWKLPCKITGILAGSNTIHNTEPDASEMYFKTGRLVSYLYSLSDNRDVMKKHDPAKNYNLYWELLLSSAKKPLKGFALTESIRKDQMEYEIDSEDDRIAFYFGKPDDNQAGILEIQKGILDFVEEYDRHFKNYPYMYEISGRDAYAPMLAASGYHERYLKEIYRRFCLRANVE